MLEYEPRRVELRRTSDSYAAHEAALMGEELLARHNFEDAEAAFRIALKADPHNPVLVMGLADVYLVSEDRARAHEWYHKALELVPDLACAHNGVGLSAPSLDEAEAAFRLASEFAPESPVYKANLAWALYHLGVRAEAVATFMEVIERAPGDLGFAQALCSILEEDKHLREAEFCMRRVLEPLADEVQLSDQAWLMYRLRAFDQADKLFRQSCRYNYDRAAAFARHGRLALAVHLPKLAVASLKRAVALSPRSESFHRDLAVALDAAGDSFVADAARTRAGQMRRARKRSTDELAVWARAAI